MSTTGRRRGRGERAARARGGLLGERVGGRAYVRTRTSRIAAGRSRGVSAASGAGRAPKNGRLRPDTTGLWDVNSVGRITSGGHRCLVVVHSDGDPSMKDGIALVERTAGTAVSSARAR